MQPGITATSEVTASGTRVASSLDLPTQGRGLGADAGNRPSVEDLADAVRVGRLPTPNLSSGRPLQEALLEAGALEPGSATGIAGADTSGYPVATELGGHTRPDGLTVREGSTAVQIRDADGRVRAVIGTEEYNVLAEAGLRPAPVSGQVAMVRDDIQLDLRDGLGQTNAQRLSRGLAPIDTETRLPIELHHVGQAPTGPLAELRMDEHRQAPNNLILHPNRNGSEVEHGSEWAQQKASHWTARAQSMGVTDYV